MNGTRTPRTFYIKTYGCQMNERDSEIIAQKLLEAGYVETSEASGADLIILNTCSIRAKAQQKVMSLLGYLRKLKAKKRKLRICVAGCVAQQEGQAIIDRMPHVDLVVGTQQIYDLPELLERAINEGSGTATELVDVYKIPHLLPPRNSPLLLSASPVKQFSRFVTIMQGCNNFCTYCVVPYTRGRESSRSADEIIEEVKLLLSQGIVEITLLGQNVNSYGKTNTVSQRAGYDFADLLRNVSALPGLQRLRFTTSNPKDLSDDLMRCFRELPNLCPQFHLPVQAGSNVVLKRMNRRYTREHYLELVAKLREYRPDIALTTDVIVGFPGETDDDFAQTMDLLESVRYDGSFSFKYSDRPGTASLGFPDKLPEEIKSERLARFQERQNQISLEKNSAFVKREIPVLVEGKGERSYKCRSLYNHVVHVTSTAELRQGSTVNVTITHAGRHSLRGRASSAIDAIGTIGTIGTISAINAAGA